MNKTALQVFASTIALAGLLSGVAAHATNLAELPLKASVLAKPNVIWGMDDSGSMDWEVLFNTNSGQLWWNNTTRTSWGAGGVPLVSSDYRMTYLFPNGTGVGAQQYSNADTNGKAVPPTPQFATARSSSYNPLYYDPTVTYAPWPKAHHDGALQPYGNASPTAAKSHPALALSVTMNLTVDQTADVHYRTGMRRPDGTTDGTIATSNALVSTTYYPATYWVLDTACVPKDASLASDCVNTPDGRKLKRVEIKRTSYPADAAGDAAYTAAIQNFANWWSYYRKRKLMLAGSMGQVMEYITGLRMGVVRFNSRTPVTMFDSDSTDTSKNRLAIAGMFYTNPANGSTPTEATLAYIGNQFETNTTSSLPDERLKSIVQYACQRNNAFIVTDGFANGGGTAPSYSSAKWGTGWPYQTTVKDSLADIALAYYTRNTRNGRSWFVDGAVPPPPADPTNPNLDLNPDLHVNTYAITLGARGTIWPMGDFVDPGDGKTKPKTPWTHPFTWPTPVNDDPTSIDDLWHATINGRGQMYLASSPKETAQAVQAGLTDIQSQVGAQGGIAVSSINLDRGDSQAYLGTYNPAGWSGDLTARDIDKTTGAVSGKKWSASDELDVRAWGTRVIATSSGGVGVGFTAAAVGGVVNPGSVYGDTTSLMNYLRGDRSGEGPAWRKRVSLIGAVINAEPLLSRADNLVYVASGEGMLHAFDTVTGAEHWAFVPPFALPEIGQTAVRGYTFRTKLDATPTLGVAGSKRILVGGMGAAGRGYYALDVTSPRGMDEATLASKAMWQFPAAGDTTTQAKMGYTVGQPVIAKTADHGTVALVTSGYDNGFTIGDGKGRLWMLNADTGAILHEFVTTDGTTAAEAGLAHVSGFLEKDGTVRFAYGGDLLGNVWVFDLKLKTTTKLAVLKDAMGNTQPVTAAPELVMNGTKRLVLVGTGRLLDIGDFGSSKVQSFYAFTDGTYMDNARSSLVKQTYVRGASPELTNNPVDWTTGRGWYFDLPAGEQANTQPTIAYGAVAFVTNMNGGADCSQTSYLYLVDVTSGSVVPSAPGSPPNLLASFLISDKATSSRVITLRVKNGKIIGTTHTSDDKVYRKELPLDKTIKPSKNAWREVRPD
jgi:type IV pilus assembly protein PilY1